MKALLFTFVFIIACSKNSNENKKPDIIMETSDNGVVTLVDTRLGEVSELKFTVNKNAQNSLKFYFKKRVTLEAVDQLIYFIKAYKSENPSIKIPDSFYASLICDLSLSGAPVKVQEKALMEITKNFIILDNDRTNLRNLLDVLLFRSRPEFVCKHLDLSKFLLNNKAYYENFFDLKLLNKKVGSVTFLSTLDHRCANPEKYHKTKERILLSRNLCTRGRSILTETLGAR